MDADLLRAWAEAIRQHHETPTHQRPTVLTQHRKDQ